MILGTSIAGVLRKEFDKGLANNIFGDKNGSKVFISNALLLDENNQVKEELLLEKTKFLKLFDNLPIREHTVLNDKGVSDNKFDEEVVYKGSRFKFSIEMNGDFYRDNVDENIDINLIKYKYMNYHYHKFQDILNLLYLNSFRLGGGSTKGFGSIKVIDIKWDRFDKDSYKDYSSSLNTSLAQSYKADKITSNSYTKYTLSLTPEDFFIFGSGFGDEKADNTPVYEKVIDYERGDVTQKQILIPASSIKGAISHRVAYHYNRYLLEKNQNNNKNYDYKKTGEDNEAVKILFGHKKEEKDGKELGQKGKILISDCFESKAKEKVFDHVAIDRFTGGAIEGALFQEKTITYDDKFTVEILLEKDDENIPYQKAIRAFEDTLKDIKNGMLPLGGMTTKGHGIFSGSVEKDGEEL